MAAPHDRPTCEGHANRLPRHRIPVFSGNTVQRWHQPPDLSSSCPFLGAAGVGAQAGGRIALAGSSRDRWAAEAAGSGPPPDAASSTRTGRVQVTPSPSPFPRPARYVHGAHRVPRPRLRSEAAAVWTRGHEQAAGLWLQVPSCPSQPRIIPSGAHTHRKTVFFFLLSPKCLVLQKTHLRLPSIAHWEPAPALVGASVL